MQIDARAPISSGHGLLAYSMIEFLQNGSTLYLFIVLPTRGGTSGGIGLWTPVAPHRKVKDFSEISIYSTLLSAF